MSALPRTPSIRELEARPRPNVVVLPTAARRQVEQRMNNLAREARKALRAETAGRFGYVDPQLRAAEPMARAVLDYGGSALALLLIATLEAMPREERLAMVERLGQIEGEEGKQAQLLARTTCLTVGESFALARAMARLQGEG